jgi:hypothetical protein
LWCQYIEKKKPFIIEENEKRAIASKFAKYVEIFKTYFFSKNQNLGRKIKNRLEYFIFNMKTSEMN